MNKIKKNMVKISLFSEMTREKISAGLNINCAEWALNIVRKNIFMLRIDCRHFSQESYGFCRRFVTPIRINVIEQIAAKDGIGNCLSTKNRNTRIISVCSAHEAVKISGKYM